MNAINGYVFNLVCIIVLAGICTILLPESRLGKYVNLVFGILIITAIMKPLFQMKNIDFNNILPDIGVNDTQNVATEYNTQVARDFTIRLSSDISSYINQTYGCSSTVKVTPLLNTNGNLEGIKEINIQTDEALPFQKLAGDISIRYGVEKHNIKIRGGG